MDATEEMEPVDTSPWAGSDRDYTYEEVALYFILTTHTHTHTHTPAAGKGVPHHAAEEPKDGGWAEEEADHETTSGGPSRGKENIFCQLYRDLQTVSILYQNCFVFSLEVISKLTSTVVCLL